MYQTVRHLLSYADVHVVCPLPRYPDYLLPKFDHRPADLSYSPEDVRTLYILSRTSAPSSLMLF